MYNLRPYGITPPVTPGPRHCHRPWSASTTPPPSRITPLSSVLPSVAGPSSHNFIGGPHDPHPNLVNLHRPSPPFVRQCHPPIPPTLATGGENQLPGVPSNPVLPILRNFSQVAQEFKGPFTSEQNRQRSIARRKKTPSQVTRSLAPPAPAPVPPVKTNVSVMLFPHNVLRFFALICSLPARLTISR